jgi:hypothetical protein
MTGRGAGYCRGFGVPGFANPIPRGGRFGRGRYYRGYAPYLAGWRTPYSPYGYGADVVPPVFPQGFTPGYPQEQELTILKDQAQMLSQQLEQINRRIKDLEEGQSE